MHTKAFSLWALVLLVPTAGLPTGKDNSQSVHWSWQQTYAEVDPKGDLRWKPHPFVVERGASVRCIGFAAGDDESSGDTLERAWKRHPWDPLATGQAAAASGVHTYIFKRGVVYRGRLRVKDPGRSGEPVRLTSDPAWGTGEAVLCGSERVVRWTRGADHPDIPEPEKVWWADLDFAPRSVWCVGSDGQISRIPLARTPNWKVSNADDVKSEWWVWDNPGKPFGNTITNARGQPVHLGIDTRNIRDKPVDYFRGALIWPEFGWVMSAPYPTEVEVVDLEQHGLGFGGWTGGGTGGVIMRNMRYYLEDKPHYLDDPDGEYWFDRKGSGGRLYLRLSNAADPNQAQIEAGRWSNLVDGEKVEHLHITGLTFRFTTPAWSITSAPWDFSTRPYGLRPDQHPGAVRVWGSGRDIRIANCRFEHVFFPIRIRSLVAGQRVDDVRIEDSLMMGAAGRLAFRVQGPDTAGSVESRGQVNDGHWHHAIVEADREAETLTLYLNGRKDATARGVDASFSLANDGDVHVGGTPNGRYLDGALDFLRFAHGTLADADTTIEELYAWQFDGPFLRDFAGRKPAEGERTVGAIKAQ